MKKFFSVIILLISTLTIQSCKKDKDPCLDIICKNGGTCVNGQCQCPDGYSGVSCSNQVTPALIKVKSISVEGYPQTDNGAGWDLTSGPDIYVELSLDNTVIYTSGYYQNQLGTANWSNLNIEINNPNSTYTIRLYDFDELDEDDYMGGYTFTPYSSTSGFPQIRNISSGSSFKFNLSLEYFW